MLHQIIAITAIPSAMSSSTISLKFLPRRTTRTECHSLSLSFSPAYRTSGPLPEDGVQLVKGTGEETSQVTPLLLKWILISASHNTGSFVPNWQVLLKLDPSDYTFNITYPQLTHLMLIYQRISGCIKKIDSSVKWDHTQSH